MLAKIKSKLPALPSSFGTLFQDMKSINTLSLRRGGLGIGFGVLLILFISLFTGKAQIPSFDFDTEKFSIAYLFPERGHEKDSFYSFFKTNKSELNAKQIHAIKTNAPRLSLVINDLGQSKQTLKSITDKLPSSVTLSLSPYTPTYNAVAFDLKSKGFEVWLNLQSQTLELDTDNGISALSPAHNLDKNLTYFEAQLKDKSYITGLTLDPRSLIISSDSLWGNLSSEFFAEGYAIFDDTATILPSSFYYHKDTPAPYIKGDARVLTNASLDSLKTKLHDLSAQIQQEKNLTLTTTIYTPAALDILVDWVNSLEEAGITLIPLSAQAKL